MHMFASERPEASPGLKALLIEGSAIPHVIVRPISANTVAISVMLRNYADADNRSYSYREAKVETLALGRFFNHYTEDPEAALESMFGWKADAKVHPPQWKSIYAPTYQPPPDPNTLTEAEDLL